MKNATNIPAHLAIASRIRIAGILGAISLVLPWEFSSWRWGYDVSWWVYDVSIQTLASPGQGLHTSITPFSPLGILFIIPYIMFVAGTILLLTGRSDLRLGAWLMLLYVLSTIMVAAIFFFTSSPVILYIPIGQALAVAAVVIGFTAR